MTRVALVSGPDPGHTLPLVAVGSALVERGHHVVLLSGEDRAADAADAGLEFDELPLEWPSDDHEDLGYRLWGMAGALAPATADVLARHEVEVVVVDTLTQSGAFAAELHGVPWVELVPHYLTDPDPAIPPIGLGRRPARGILSRADHRRLRQLESRSRRQGAAQRADVRADLGLTGHGRPSSRIVAWFPSLEHPRARWPGDTHLVGPLGWDPPLPELAVPAGPQPLVVVTDSSANTVPWSLGRRVLEALDGVGPRVVVVTRDDLPPPDERSVVGWGPHGPLLDQADVVVTPGGAGVLGKAFARGVPAVVVPIHGDQFESAGRVAQFGAGRRLLPLRRSSRRIRAAVLEVLHDPSYRRQARRLAREAADLGGPAVAARIVLDVAAGRHPVATGPQR